MIRRIQAVALFALFLGLLIHVPGKINAQENLHTIRLKSGDITAPANAGAFLDGYLQSGGEQAPVQVLIHFSKLPGDAERLLLKQAGLTLLEYVPENTFVAILQ